jgi:AbrB family looped-hinge helix DNA binding protein
VGEKGQVVIPAEARRKLGIQKGDKLLVFGQEDHSVLILIEADRVSEQVSRMLDELTELSSALGLSRKKGR